MSAPQFFLRIMAYATYLFLLLLRFAESKQVLRGTYRLCHLPWYKIALHFVPLLCCAVNGKFIT